MKALIITYEGLEDACSAEVKEILKSKTSKKDSVVITEAGSQQDICLLTYKLQSAIKVLQLLDDFNFKTLKELETKFKSLDLSKLLKKDISFVVRCMRSGKHDFHTSDVEKAIGTSVFEKYGNKVDLENPDLTIYLYVKENTCYAGIDFAGIDLSKREYKVFSHPSALKGPVAFLLLKLAGYSKDKLFLDPFCGSGTIPIEAALYASGISPNFYNKDNLAFTKILDFDFDSCDKSSDKKQKLKINAFDHNLQSVSASKKNAKIAGIDKLINFSRVDVEWIDTKLDKESVDVVVTNPPIKSKINSSAMVEKIYKELFYQLDFVLKKDGVVVFISRKTELLKKESEKKGFKLDEERTVKIGKEHFNVLLFKR